MLEFSNLGAARNLEKNFSVIMRNGFIIFPQKSIKLHCLFST